MIIKFLKGLFVMIGFSVLTSGCMILQKSSKNAFNDGIYQTKRFSHARVYVLKVDDDTIAVFPIKQFKDSTAIITKDRVNYTSLQKKFKDGKVSHAFYKPSFDLDAMTITLKYRPTVNGFPNQLTTNFNGALYGGYRIDEYKIHYKRTPLNVYKQNVKHAGYSIGLYAGIGSTLIDASTLAEPNFTLQYEGVLLITGIAANMAYENLTFGISFGPDYLLDKYHDQWIYEGKPSVGFTLGLNIN